MTGAQAAFLPDGRRLHLHHGPIDLIVGVEGKARGAALRRAETRFATILEELVAELPRLRRPGTTPPRGAVARRMAEAVAPFHGSFFVTPMAAVAGAVADEILAEIRATGDICKAYVNNGGDVAFHLSEGTEITAAIAGAGPAGLTVRPADPVRGVATSGWRGRSHSLGIADNVTVLARTAAKADVAATLIANAVDLPGHPAVTRVPARDLAPDSDLGRRPVTTAVGQLDPSEVAAALAAGLAFAEDCRRRGLIAAASLGLCGQTRLCGAGHFAARTLPEPFHA